ncbi:TPA: hypothetical protein ACH3X3_007583 [Trebouxia sp. C0006]
MTHVSSQAAQGRVDQLEAEETASVAALHSKEQKRLQAEGLAQADRAKLLPWSSAMGALFIDPSGLTQGGPLGASTTGVHTYSGTYTRTGSSQPIQIALKALVLPSPAGMAAFEERVQMLWQASADGHHICRILGVSCLRGQAVLVTKLYRQRLANEMTSKSGDMQKLPKTVVIQRGIDICRGLQDLHAAGIIMRSLNQANVFLTSSGTAVLAVSGLAPDGHDGDNHHPQSLYRVFKHYKWTPIQYGQK